MYCRQGATCGGKWGACSGSSALGGWGGGGEGVGSVAKWLPWGKDAPATAGS